MHQLQLWILLSDKVQVPLLLSLETILLNHFCMSSDDAKNTAVDRSHTGMRIMILELRD